MILSVFVCIVCPLSFNCSSLFSNVTNNSFSCFKFSISDIKNEFQHFGSSFWFLSIFLSLSIHQRFLELSDSHSNFSHSWSTFVYTFYHLISSHLTEKSWESTFKSETKKYENPDSVRLKFSNLTLLESDCVLFADLCCDSILPVISKPHQSNQYRLKMIKCKLKQFSGQWGKIGGVYLVLRDFVFPFFTRYCRALFFCNTFSHDFSAPLCPQFP
jgi:hypothetical protein